MNSKDPAREAIRSYRRGVRFRRVLAWVTALAGLINLAWALYPLGILTWIGGASPVFDAAIERQQAFLSGCGLLFLASGLSRGKRLAWLTLVSLLLPLVMLYAANGPYWQKLIPATVMILALVVFYRQFPARSNPASVRSGLKLWGIGLALSLGLAVGGGLIKPLAVTDIREAVDVALLGFALSLSPAGLNLQVPADVMLALHFILGAGSWSALLWLLMRPMPAPEPAGSTEIEQARHTVQDYGCSSMAYLALLPDKSYFYSSGGSLIAYTVCGRTAVTLGDPIGSRDDALQAILEFTVAALRNDWRAAFALTEADTLPYYRKMGFHVLCLGHEGIIDLDEFTLRGNASKTIRKRYNRLSRLGFRVEVYEPPIADGLLVALREVNHEWLRYVRTAEKRFFMAVFTDEYVRGERLMVAYAPDGTICAFANLVPEYQRSELTIDLMRRRHETESGLMDFFFTSLLLWASKQGYQTFNLGLTPLYKVGEQPGSNLLERVIRLIYHSKGFYDFRGLSGFKTKFRPRWSPQYLIYPSIVSMPVVGIGVAQANAGKGESLWSYFLPPKARAELEPQGEIIHV